MIIDAHAHIAEGGIWLGHDKAATAKRLYAAMDAAGIDMAVILPIFPAVPADFVARECPPGGRLIGFSSLDPRADDAPLTLERYVESGLKGLKLHPRLQKFRPDDGRVIRVLEKAALLEVPVIMDAWAANGSDDSLIDGLAAAAGAVPGLKLVVAHLCGHAYKKAPYLADSRDNVWFDLSFILTRLDREVVLREVPEAIARIGPERLIYGSDFPDAMPAEALTMTREVCRLAGFTDADIEKVLGGNMLRLMGGTI